MEWYAFFIKKALLLNFNMFSGRSARLQSWPWIWTGHQVICQTCFAGVDVVITIFCDFPQFSAKKLVFFLNKHCYDQMFAKLAVCGLSKKRQFFHQFFSAKLF
jgi:hypothetical protein